MIKYFPLWNRKYSKTKSLISDIFKICSLLELILWRKDCVKKKYFEEKKDSVKLKKFWTYNVINDQPSELWCVCKFNH
jgi:hypothetical protein